MNASPLVDIALAIARRPVADLDVARLVSETCAALPAALGVPAAVVVVLEPAGAAGVYGSDATAGLIGEAQHRSANGPLPHAVRSGRVLLTPDLTRVGPPALAAAAADSGLVSSAAVAVQAGDRAVGGLQLLGTAAWPVTARHLDAVRPVVEVLGARLGDVQAQQQLAAVLARSTGDQQRAVQIEQATGMLAERYRTDVEEALRFLQGQARHAGRSLVDAAAAVIAGTDGPAAVPQPRPEPQPAGSVMAEPAPRHRRRAD
jgi:hypothetical protein